MKKGRKIVLISRDRRGYAQGIDLLIAHGYQVYTTGNSYEAGFQTALYEPDLIIIDFSTKDVDWSNVLAVLLNKEGLTKVEILAILDPGKKQQGALSICGVSQIYKPVLPRFLLQKVQSLLKCKTES